MHSVFNLQYTNVHCTGMHTCFYVLMYCSLQAHCIISNLYMYAVQCTLQRHEQLSAVLRPSVLYTIYTCRLYMNEQFFAVLWPQCIIYNLYMYTVQERTVFCCTAATVYYIQSIHVHCTGMNSILCTAATCIIYNLYMYTVQEWTVFCCTVATV